jgi:hypothetical protein
VSLLTGTCKVSVCQVLASEPANMEVYGVYFSGDS